LEPPPRAFSDVECETLTQVAPESRETFAIPCAPGQEGCSGTKEKPGTKELPIAVNKPETGNSKPGTRNSDHSGPRIFLSWYPEPKIPEPESRNPNLIWTSIYDRYSGSMKIT
jgi:hypothetical protein